MPASLAILIGAAFVAANLLLHPHNAISWAIPIYLIIVNSRESMARLSRKHSGALIVME